MPRLFTGIPIIEKTEILHLQDDLKLRFPNSRITWVARENFHITLRFLGETEELYLNSVCLALREAASQINSFQLIPKGPGFFGPKKHPKVIWHGYQVSEKINQLVSIINENLCQLGFQKEEKPFRAHVTLGRVKVLSEIREFEDFMQQHREKQGNNVQVKGFSLYKSELKPAGPVYKELEYFQLKGSG